MRLIAPLLVAFLAAALPAVAQHVDYLEKFPRGSPGPVLLVETDGAGKPTSASVVIPSFRSDYNDFCRWMAQATNYPLLTTHKFYLRFPEKLVEDNQPLPWALLKQKQLAAKAGEQPPPTVRPTASYDGAVKRAYRGPAFHDGQNFWPMAEYVDPAALDRSVKAGSEEADQKAPTPQVVPPPPAAPRIEPADSMP